MNKRQWIIASVLAGTIGVAGFAHAFGDYDDYSDKDRCKGKKGKHGGKSYVGGFHMGEFRHLELTDEQKTAIKAIKTEYREQMDTTRNELTDVKKSLFEQSSTEVFDATKVRELADAEAALMSDILVQRVQTMHNIRQQLTEEQVAELEEHRAEHENEGHHHYRHRH